MIEIIEFISRLNMQAIIDLIARNIKNYTFMTYAYESHL